MRLRPSCTKLHHTEGALQIGGRHQQDYQLGVLNFVFHIGIEVHRQWDAVAGNARAEDRIGWNPDRFLQEIYLHYDYIIIDSSPVLAADDTTSLAPKIDATLFVVRLSYRPQGSQRILSR